MATGSEYWALPGLVATGALGAYQYYPVKPGTTAGTVKVASAASDKVIGILQNDPADAEPAEVAALGACKAIAGANNIAAGDRLKCNTSGVTATTTGGDNVVGVALEASAAVGDIIRILAVPSTMGD